MSDYDTPNVPPATPPAIDPDADPVSARELARKDGDSEVNSAVEGHSASNEANRSLAGDMESTEGSERADLNRRLSKREALDGAGEQALDGSRPETLLPPD